MNIDVLFGAQVEHAKYKAEVEQRTSQDKAEIKKLEEELASLQRESERKSGFILDLEGRLEALRQTANMDRATLEVPIPCEIQRRGFFEIKMSKIIIITFYSPWGPHRP